MTPAGVLLHPVNGHRVEVHSGFSWPCLLLGCFWYGFKGMWGSAVIAFFGALFTGGIACLFFPFFANDHHVKFLEKQGYLTAKQASEKEAASGALLGRMSHTQAAAPTSVADELSKLASLRDSGVLSEAEFDEQKQRLLAVGDVRSPVG